MGVFTLEMFREEMASSLSERGHGNPFYDNKINMAYIEVLTAFGHEVLKECKYMDTVADENHYEGPADLEGFISVTDVTDSHSRRRLIYTEIQNFKQFEPDLGIGNPEYYTRLGNSLYLYPISSSVRRIEMIYWKSVPRMAERTDVSILSYRWDPAIAHLAKSYAHADLGNKDKAEYWFTRGISYIRSRYTERDMDSQQLAAPVWIPRSWEELTEGRG